MSIQVGQTAPDFTLKTNKMQDFALSEAKGKKNNRHPFCSLRLYRWVNEGIVLGSRQYQHVAE